MFILQLSFVSWSSRSKRVYFKAGTWKWTLSTINFEHLSLHLRTLRPYSASCICWDSELIFFLGQPSDTYPFPFLHRILVQSFLPTFLLVLPTVSPRQMHKLQSCFQNSPTGMRWFAHFPGLQDLLRFRLLVNDGFAARLFYVLWTGHHPTIPSRFCL